MKLLYKYKLLSSVFFISILAFSCSDERDEKPYYQSVNGIFEPKESQYWLSHEHILVDFIGADSIDQDDWKDDPVVETMLPYLDSLKQFDIGIFVDATPQYLGRDVQLLRTLSNETNIEILTNTGLYGAVGNKYIPKYAFGKSAEELSDMWIKEFHTGIDSTGIKPGFIKISVDNQFPLEEMDEKLVRAAALTHLKTGLTIASHTGKAQALWPQLEILEEYGVAPEAFIWVHAQNELNNLEYLKAAEKGCWISLDGLGWELENHVDKLIFAKENGILDKILISHDAGWYDPQKKEQTIQSYTPIFKRLIPKLLENGFTKSEIDQLLIQNPAIAFGISKRLL